MANNEELSNSNPTIEGELVSNFDKLDKKIGDLAAVMQLNKNDRLLLGRGSSTLFVTATRVADFVTDTITDSNGKIKSTMLPPKSFSPFGLRIFGEKLIVVGVEGLLAQGYVPYVFRYNKKALKFKDNLADDAFKMEYISTHGSYRKIKGWNVFGSYHAVRIADDGVVEFSTSDKADWHLPPGHSRNPEVHSEFSSAPTTLIDTFYRSTSSNGNRVVYPMVLNDHEWSCNDFTDAWVRNNHTRVSLYTLEGNPRLVKLRYALAFGKPHPQDKHAVTPAEMVTPLVEFAVCISPTQNEHVVYHWWCVRFGRI